VIRTAGLHPPDVVLLCGDLTDEGLQSVAAQLTDPVGSKSPLFISLTARQCSGAGGRRIDLHSPKAVNWIWLHQLLRRFQSIVMPDANV
jgi:hypothetical protein